MTFQILFTGENKKNVLKCCLPRVLSINMVASALMTIFSMHHIALDKVLFLSPTPQPFGEWWKGHIVLPQSACPSAPEMVLAICI